MNACRSTLKIIFLVALFMGCKNAYAAKPDTLIMKEHLKILTKTKYPRNHLHQDQLNASASYIKSVFEEYGDSVFYQPYKVRGRTFKNVICSFGMEHSERLIIGAHYDVCEFQQGADDNASGVVGLLELARMLKSQELEIRIDLVAYTLEEPPFFKTENMGSFIHAKSLVDANVDVIGMVCLEMIGYFRDEKKTQDYPLGIMSLFYGSRGNYIALVKKWGAGKFSRLFARKFKDQDLISCKRVSAPKIVPGIDFSDHLNYWKFGFGALMITDTAFYRNKNYHKTTDQLETLDLNRMAHVIQSVYQTTLSL